MPFKIIRNDITKLRVDAIVNSANPDLCQDAGVCGAVFMAAGERKLQKACQKIGRCETGQAVITRGFALPAKYIIHTVGPVWNGGYNREQDLLYSCYHNSLSLARTYDCQSIAFPLISSGILGYPRDQALQTAVAAIKDFLLNDDISVALAVFDHGSLMISEELYCSVKSFLDDNYIEFQLGVGVADNNHYDHNVHQDHLNDFDTSDYSSMQSMNPPVYSKAPSDTQIPNLYYILSCLDESFSQCLLRLINEKNLPDAIVYKRANIDRRLFSKIRSNPAYQPSKNTVIAFAVALELSIDETNDLLMKAGYALSRSSKLDLIVEYYIHIKNYNIFEINQTLFAFGQGLLGN